MHTADDSPEYYRMREEHERQLAESASNDEAGHVHLTLAESYARLAEDVANLRQVRS